MYSVEITPYSGYGCMDTLKAIVKAVKPPVSEAGNNALVCGSGNVQLGASPNPRYTYQWSPAEGLNNITAANPIASPVNSTLYTFTTADTASGCSATDTVRITVSRIDTAIALQGKTVYCGSKSISALLSVSPGTAVQWFDKEQVAGSNASLLIRTPGNYYALLRNADGCADSTRRITISSHPVPVARFSVADTSQA